MPSHEPERGPLSAERSGGRGDSPALSLRAHPPQRGSRLPGSLRANHRRVSQVAAPPGARPSLRAAGTSRFPRRAPEHPAQRPGPLRVPGWRRQAAHAGPIGRGGPLHGGRGKPPKALKRRRVKRNASFPKAALAPAGGWSGAEDEPPEPPGGRRGRCGRGGRATRVWEGHGGPAWGLNRGRTTRQGAGWASGRRKGPAAPRVADAQPALTAAASARPADSRGAARDGSGSASTSRPVPAARASPARRDAAAARAARPPVGGARGQ